MHEESNIHVHFSLIECNKIKPIYTYILSIFYFLFVGAESSPDTN
jgi:hypothetical protein